MEDKKQSGSAAEIWAILKETSNIGRETKIELAQFKKEEAARRKEEAARRKEEAARREEEAARRKKLDQTLREMAESRKKSEESVERLERALEKSHRETDRHIQKVGGRFNERWGRFIESLVSGNLVSLLKERGIRVDRHFERAEKDMEGENGVKRRREFDIVALNGHEAVVVEVKTVLSPGKTNEFLAALKDFKICFPEYKDKTLYAAVAYLSCEDEAEVYAERQGLFVIKATGDPAPAGRAHIINRKDFKPKPFFS